jgi:hypothetical protein
VQNTCNNFPLVIGCFAKGVGEAKVFDFFASVVKSLGCTHDLTLIVAELANLEIADDFRFGKVFVF